MIFKNYEYFITIADEGSISKAAEKLFISQPSLSKYLKRLEENVGEELFCRESYPLKLTKAGELYLSYLKDISGKEQQLKEEFSYLKTNDIGTISIGITVWRSSIFMPLIMPVFKHKFPGIKVSIQEGTHQQMAAMIENGKVDFSIFHLPNNYYNFTFEHLLYEKILFCVHRSNPLLARFPNLDLAKINLMPTEAFKQFGNENFILLKSGQNMRDIAQNYLNKLRLEPPVFLETSNIVTAINMVKTGLGVTFVPEAALTMQDNFQDLCYFIVDTPPLQWEIGIAHKTGCPPKRQARLFIDCMKELLSADPIFTPSFSGGERD